MLLMDVFRFTREIWRRQSLAGPWLSEPVVIFASYTGFSGAFREKQPELLSTLDVVANSDVSDRRGKVPNGGCVPVVAYLAQLWGTCKQATHPRCVSLSASLSRCHEPRDARNISAGELADPYCTAIRGHPRNDMGRSGPLNR